MKTWVTKTVVILFLLALPLLLLGCLSEDFIREGYSPSGVKTVEVDLVFPELFLVRVRGVFVYLVMEVIPSGKYFIRVETFQDREWDIHSVYFLVDEKRFDFVAFEKRPWSSFSKKETAVFETSLDFFQELNQASEIKIHIIGSKESRLLDLDPYHYEAIHNYMSLLEPAVGPL